MKPDPRRDELLQELYQRLKALYGDRLDRLILYGSHARGENREGSDVDVLVVLEGPLKSVFNEIDRIVEITYELGLEYGEHISALPMSREEYIRGKSPLLHNVRREGKMVEPIAA